jgi:hypothetical protein
MKRLCILLLAPALLLVSCDAEPQDMNPTSVPGVHKGSSIGGDGEKDPDKTEDVNRKSKAW